MKVVSSTPEYFVKGFGSQVNLVVNSKTGIEGTAPYSDIRQFIRAPAVY